MKLRGLRWWLLGLIVLATVINYLDRMTINLSATEISRLYHLNKKTMALVFSAFLWAYTLGFGPVGWLMDKLGTRRGYIVSMSVWSAAGVLTAFAVQIGGGIKAILPVAVAPVVLGFLLCRFMLGLGESGNWPVAIKAISEWFPSKERSFAVGFFNSGSSLGAVIAPPLIASFLLPKYGWQAAFVIVGVVGFLWLGVWWLFFQPPDRHPLLHEKEHAYIKQDEGATAAGTGEALRWKDLLRFRQVRGIVITRFFMDPIWWFYTFWLPTYLVEQRGFTLIKMGLYAAIPFLTSDVGNIFGGWASSFFISRGWEVNRARKTVMVASAAVMLLGIAVPFVSSPLTCVFLISVVTFFYQSWSVNMLTIPSDLVRPRLVASVVGLSGMGAGFGGIVITYLTGWLVDRTHSFTSPIVLVGLLPLIGVSLLFLAIGRIQRVGEGERSLSPN